MIILQKTWIQLSNGEWYLGEEEIKKKEQHKNEFRKRNKKNGRNVENSHKRKL